MKRQRERLTELLRPQRTEHWGSVYRFTPALLNKVYGDGKRLVQLFPINERPRYWVIRVDSSCDDRDAFVELLDDIYDEIDEQFGSPDESDLGVGNDRPYFPMHDCQGCSWHFVYQPELEVAR